MQGVRFLCMCLLGVLARVRGEFPARSAVKIWKRIFEVCWRGYAVRFQTGVHDPGIWLPLSSRVTALENSGHLFERSELCPLFSALSSLPGG